MIYLFVKKEKTRKTLRGNARMVGKEQGNAKHADSRREDQRDR